MSGILADTFPNRLYLHSGETDRISDTLDSSSLPTIWDRLDAKNVSSAYYFHDVPFTSLYGTRYVGRSKLFASFLADAAAGTLPSFCMVDPRFGGEALGTSNDDHPYADIRNGQVLLGQIYDALRTSPTWSRTLMIIVYDEWGGFMEHVAPPVKPVSAAEQAVGNDGRLGFRVPCMLLGPRVRQNYVSRYPFDPSSIHQLIAWRFGLDPLGVRASDSSTFNMAYALDLQSAARTDAPAIAVTQGVFGSACPIISSGSITSGIGQLDHRAPTSPSDGSMATSDAGGRFADLHAKAVALGFPVAP
jgi:phospholipase C